MQTRAGIGVRVRGRSLLGIALAAVAVLAAPAGAEARSFKDVPVSELKDTTTYKRFKVWYTSKTGSPHAVTQAKAEKLARLAQKVYDLEKAKFAWPDAPKDADGKIDVFVYKFSKDEGGFARVDSAERGPSTGFIAIQASKVNRVKTIAHEVFHILELGVYSDPTGTMKLAFEGAAAWATARVTGTDGDETPFHLVGEANANGAWCPGLACDGDGAYRMWPLYEFLERKYGVGTVRKVFENLGKIVLFDSPPAGYTVEQSIQESAIEKAAGLTKEELLPLWFRTNTFGDYTFKVLKGKRAFAFPLRLEAGGQKTKKIVMRPNSAMYIRLLEGGCDKCQLLVGGNGGGSGPLVGRLYTENGNFDSFPATTPWPEDATARMLVWNVDNVEKTIFVQARSVTPGQFGG